ncbi:hypothetical protein FNV43_RR15105 [Rhamnella rubrinervis]|uniref:ABC transporter domain-containing protein n=1 Tax=Rhamnella rubrinervis TaxID=2594499 RepID=A0A8K0GX73_9ROSA|nr:hypothetical protein FNV43_RR15105 [Rhamnella rubrinervis]
MSSLAEPEHIRRRPYLVWQDLTVVVAKSRKLLNDLTGFAQPNKLMALMGPSGSGKSTLLDALAGRLSANVKMTGNVTYKGKMESRNSCAGISYMTQEDVFLGTLTVRETITYSANLRVSDKSKSKEDIKELVERTITEMGLENCADNKIGNWHLRGISNGEKKRLSIGLEILTQPYTMLLDEPTTGLDSASAYFVILSLRNIALDGRIVVCSIHQPSYYLFDLFHDFYLLSCGEAVYFGEAKLAVKGITTLSDSLVNLTTREIKEILIQKYKASEYSTTARNKLRDMTSTVETLSLSNKSNSSTLWCKQLDTLIRRSCVNMSRDMGYYWLRILFYVLVSVSLGSIYFRTDTSYLAITARVKCEAFIYGFMICLSIGGLPSFMEELKVFNRERLSKHYGEAVLSIANFISSLPFLVLIAVSSGAVINGMVKFHNGFSHFCYFCLSLFCCISVIECSMMVVAVLVPNVLMGIGIGTSLIVFMMMSSEIFRRPPDLPKFFWRYPMSYISFASWALQGVYKNDMVGLEFDSMVPGEYKIKGEEENDNIKMRNRGPYLVWEDITVVVPQDSLRNNNIGATRKLLNGLSGFAQPHRIMALMGPSGSGKSTLLDALSGRLSPNATMSGNVFLNGKKISTDCRDVSYVTQEDVFLGTLTVRETLAYSAHLRLPTKMTKVEKNEVVENTIAKMGLQDCAQTRIGNWHFRGISTGEKRRLSICIEIITQPHVLFLDEPTSSLDSASAFFVIWALRNIAHDGKIVICSIHQPSSDVFNFFDDLVLLSGGETVYFGEAKMAVKFFADAGFPCPTRKNPPDHFLRCISSDFDKIYATLKQSLKNYETSSPTNLTTEQVKATLIQKYKCSEFSRDAAKIIREIKLNNEEPCTESNKGSGAGRWWKQLCTLTRRSSLNMTRDVGYYWLRIVFYILVSVSAGTFFFNIGTSNRAISARGKCDGFIYGLMICLAIGGIPFFIEDIKVFNRERLGRHYGEAMFVLSNFISSIPFVIATALSSGTILYYMVNFHAGFSYYFYFCINLFLCIAVTEGCTLIVVAAVSNLLLAIGIAAGVTGQYKNDMIGLEFDPLAAGEPKLKGEYVLENMYGIRPDISKWWDLAALFCLLIFNRVIFYMVLKHKERASLFYANTLPGELSDINKAREFPQREISLSPPRDTKLSFHCLLRRDLALHYPCSYRPFFLFFFLLVIVSP